MARGVAMHRLLQSLPDIAPPARREAARRHLARAAPAFGGEERERMIARIERILDEPRFAALFLPGSRAEVPVAGRLSYRGAPVTISGQLDRLAVTADSTLAATNKTVAIAAGGVAVSANFAFADVTPDVTASIGAHADIDVTGAASVKALAAHDAIADVFTVTGGAGADLFIISTSDLITDFKFDKPQTNKDGDVVIRDGVITT